MSDILDEVLNDEKHEKNLILFRKLLPIMVAVTLTAAIFIALYNLYKTKTIAHNQEIGNMFIQLVLEGNSDAVAVDNFLEKVIDTSGNKQSELANLALVSSKIKANDIKSAIENLDKIVKNKDYSDLTKSYARIMWISLVLDEDQLTEQQTNKLLDYLEYFNNEDKEFYVTSNLLAALFYQKTNKLDLAKDKVQKVLKMENISPILREQANAIASTIVF